MPNGMNFEWNTQQQPSTGSNMFSQQPSTGSNMFSSQSGAGSNMFSQQPSTGSNMFTSQSSAGSGMFANSFSNNKQNTQDEKKHKGFNINQLEENLDVVVKTLIDNFYNNLINGNFQYLPINETSKFKVDNKIYTGEEINTFITLLKSEFVSQKYSNYTTSNYIEKGSRNLTIVVCFQKAHQTGSNCVNTFTVCYDNKSNRRYIQTMIFSKF